MSENNVTIQRAPVAFVGRVVGAQIPVYVARDVLPPSLIHQARQAHSELAPEPMRTG